MEIQGDLGLTTYCGLYCGLCAQRARIPRRAADLASDMSKEGWDKWGLEIPGFAVFWEFLQDLAGSEERCECRGGRCGPPFCEIRKCARARGVRLCLECDEYPCPKFGWLTSSYPHLLEDGKRLREIGLRDWISEQEDKACMGYAYADTRRSPAQAEDRETPPVENGEAPPGTA